MKERPILFSGPMVRAILDGRKTQTRRLLRWRPREEGINLAFSGLEVGCYSCDNAASGFVLRSRGAGSCWTDRTWPAHCPYGLVGDRLWVRETWWRGLWSEEHHYNDFEGVSRCSTSWCHHRPGDAETIAYCADGAPPGDRCERWEKVPSIFMARADSRITLDITEVRVQRLREVTNGDAKAEGVDEIKAKVPTPRDAFRLLWDDINGKRAAWSSNPWVWAITFKRAA